MCPNVSRLCPNRFFLLNILKYRLNQRTLLESFYKSGSGTYITYEREKEQIAVSLDLVQRLFTVIHLEYMLLYPDSCAL